MCPPIPFNERDSGKRTIGQRIAGAGEGAAPTRVTARAASAGQTTVSLRSFPPRVHRGISIWVD